MENKIQSIINLLFIHKDKRIVIKLINDQYLLEVYFGYLSEYFDKLDNEVLDTFIECIQRRLDNGSDIEYEFTEQEWTNLQNLKKLPAFKK